MVNIIGSNINNWKKDILHQFEAITEEFNNLKKYMDNTFLLFEDVNLIKNKTTKGNIKIFNNSIKKIFDDEKSKISNITFHNNYDNKNLFIESKKIEELFKKIKKFDFDKINSKHSACLKNNLNLLKELIDLKENSNSNYHNKKSGKNFAIKEFIPKAESYFGLDNQFEIIRYDKNYHLLVHIDNINDLELKLINKEYKIEKILILKKIFDAAIREIRYYSKKDKDIDYKYLLVSSRKNEVNIYEIIVNLDDFSNTLKEINHITEIYNNTKVNKDFYDLSSSAIRFKDKIEDSEIYITCWEGSSIKIYNLFFNKCIKEIISKTSCNIKYCNIFEDKFFIFCGCNMQDNYTCANCIDLSNLNYSIQNDNSVHFIKFSDRITENKENVFYNFIIYQSLYDNIRYLIICDEKGFLRIFNFENQELMHKINLNKAGRINTILLFKKNHLLITQKNAGLAYEMKINNTDKGINLSEEKIYQLFDSKIVSLRQYNKENNDLFLVLGKNKLKIEGFEKEEEKIIFFINQNEFTLNCNVLNS